MSKIYLACPYTHKDPNVVDMRFEVVTKKAGRLLLEGHIVYSPITHCHPIAMAVKLPTDFNFWKKLNFEFIDWSEEVRVLCIDGWRTSVGVAAEIEYANSQGKPVILI